MAKPLHRRVVPESYVQLLYEYLDDASGLREPVKIDNISFYLVLATVATEDSTFFTNPGVNYNGLVGAAWDNFSPFGSFTS